MKKILIIAPHMDDEVLGCGGTIAKHVDSGDKVFVCIIACRIYGHKFSPLKNEAEKKHCAKAKKTLGIRETIFLDLPDERLDGCIQDIIIPLETIALSLKPEVVYVPFRGGNNQDHRAVFDAARVVFRPVAAPFVKSIYMYEVPSSTEQSPAISESAFFPNYFVDITKFMDKKIKAYRFYKTEIRKFPHPRSERAIKILNQKRGIEIGFKYAEAFMILKQKWL